MSDRNVRKIGLNIRAIKIIDKTEAAWNLGRRKKGSAKTVGDYTIKLAKS